MPSSASEDDPLTARYKQGGGSKPGIFDEVGHGEPSGAAVRCVEYGAQMNRKYDQQQKEAKQQTSQSDLPGDQEGDGRCYQACTCKVHPDDTAREKGGHHFLHAGTFEKVVDTKESNDKGVEDRPYLG